MKKLFIFWGKNPLHFFRLARKMIGYLLLTPLVVASFIFYILYILILIPFKKLKKLLSKS